MLSAVFDSAEEKSEQSCWSQTSAQAFPSCWSHAHRLSVHPVSFPEAAPSVPSHRPAAQRPTAPPGSSFPTILWRSQPPSIPAHTSSPWPPSAPFSPLSSLSPPQIPLAHYLHFFLSLLHHSSLRTPHYPLSAFLILSPISHCLFPPNLPLFIASLHLLLAFANLHIAWFYWPQSNPALCIRCANIKRWEDVVGDELNNSRGHMEH